MNTGTHIIPLHSGLTCHIEYVYKVFGKTNPYGSNIKIILTGLSVYLDDDKVEDLQLADLPGKEYRMYQGLIEYKLLTDPRARFLPWKYCYQEER